MERNAKPLYGPAPQSGRYSPAECIGADKVPVMGNPNEANISTSHVERNNLTDHAHADSALYPAHQCVQQKGGLSPVRGGATKAECKDRKTTGMLWAPIVRLGGTANVGARLRRAA